MEPQAGGELPVLGDLTALGNPTLGRRTPLPLRGLLPPRMARDLAKALTSLAPTCSATCPAPGQAHAHPPPGLHTPGTRRAASTQGWQLARSVSLLGPLPCSTGHRPHRPEPGLPHQGLPHQLQLRDQESVWWGKGPAPNALCPRILLGNPQTRGPSHLFTFAQDVSLPMNVPRFSARKSSSHQPHPRCASSPLTRDIHSSYELRLQGPTTWVLVSAPPPTSLNGDNEVLPMRLRLSPYPVRLGLKMEPTTSQPTAKHAGSADAHRTPRLSPRPQPLTKLPTDRDETSRKVTSTLHCIPPLL